MSNVTENNPENVYKNYKIQYKMYVCGHSGESSDDVNTLWRLELWVIWPVETATCRPY